MPRMAGPCFQFRLSTLLWITLAVACFFGGNLVGPPVRDWYRQSRRQDCIERRAIEIMKRTHPNPITGNRS